MVPEDVMQDSEETKSDAEKLGPKPASSTGGGGGGGGLGTALGVAKTAFDVGKFIIPFFLKDGGSVPHRSAGGLVPRHGYQTAGGVPTTAEDTTAAPGPKDVYNHLISQGADPNTALMLTGAAASESNFNPTAPHDYDENGVPAGYGMFGHQGPRLAAMRQATGAEKPNWKQQATFALTEAQDPRYRDMLANAKTPEDLARVQMHFERPKGYTPENPEAGHNYAGRVAHIAALQPLTSGQDVNYPTGAPKQQTQQAYPFQQQIEGGLGKAKSMADSLAPRTYQGQDRSMGDFLTSKDFVIPLLTGLGTMASSPSRYLGAAILQGLGGGAQAYANLQKQQSDIDLTRAGTMKELSGIGPVVGQFDKNGKPVYDIKPSMFGESLKPKPAAGEPGATDTGVVPPVKPIEAVQAGVIKAPDVPMIVSTEGGRYSYDITPSNVSTQGLKDYGATGGATDRDVVPANISARPEIAKKAQDEASVANERSKLAFQSAQVRRDINTMAHAFNEIDNSASGTGPEFANRNKLFYYYNFLADRSGLPKYDAADKNLTSGFILDKLSKLQTGEFAQAGGSNAGFIQAAKSAAMPSGEMTPEAGRTLIAGMYMANQNQEDFRKFYNKYTAQYGTALGVQDAFNQEFQPRLAREKDLIMHALTPQANGVSPADILRKNPSSAAQFDKNYGMPGLARTIIGG